jgi:hypothetical protein
MQATSSLHQELHEHRNWQRYAEQLEESLAQRTEELSAVRVELQELQERKGEHSGEMEQDKGEGKQARAKELRQKQEEINSLRFGNELLLQKMREMRRNHADELDAEKVLQDGLRSEANTWKEALASSVEDLRAKLQCGLNSALDRVNYLETLLLQERTKSKKLLNVLSELVDDPEDLKVLMDESDSEDGSNSVCDKEDAERGCEEMAEDAVLSDDVADATLESEEELQSTEKEQDEDENEAVNYEAGGAGAEDDPQGMESD